MQTRKLFILASCLTVLSLLAGSCAPATTPPAAQKPAESLGAKPTAAPAAPSPTANPASGQPGYGGVVTRSMNRDVPHFDVQQGQGADISSTLFNVYQGLVRLHHLEHQKIIPELAEKWEVSPDGRTYTFKASKGIKWHDGKTFTMEDIKYSLERMQNPKPFKAISPRGEALLSAMDKAEIGDEDTIKIMTKFPAASFLPNLATGWVAIVPKHILMAKGDMKRDCVGTGPFKFKELNPGISFELEKNKDYYVKALPYLDGIRFYTIRDTATRFSAFRTGKTMITFTGSSGLTPTEAVIVRQEMAAKAVVYEHDALTRYMVVFNMRRKPWDDVRVRQAAHLAFDRQAAIKINGDRGYVGSIYAQPWGMKLDDVAKLSGYRQPKDPDIAEAKKLMAEAGFPNGFKTRLVSQTGGAVERQVVFIKDQLAKIGIDAEIILAEFATYIERSVAGNFDLLNTADTLNTSDPDETLFTNYVTGGPQNYGGFSDKQLDELIDKQAATTDPEARKQILTEIEKKIMGQMPILNSFWNIWQTGAWREVKSFNPGPGIHSFTKYDQMWLAK